MIHILNFMLILTLTKCLIEVDLNEKNNYTFNYVSQKMSTYQVASLKKKYCYVRVIKHIKQTTFQLMADYDVLPKKKLISIYKQGENIDRISELENRNTRFLKLKRQKGIIYITTSTDDIDNKLFHNITITGSNKEECDNQCSNNGICKTDGCICESSFIGNDCHQKSEEIFSSGLKEVILKDEIRFFSINLNNFLGKELVLEFETDCQECLNIIIYKTKALLKANQLINMSYAQLFNDSGEYSIIQTQIPDKLPTQQQILYLSVFRKQILKNAIHLQIRNIYSSNNDDSSNENSDRKTYIILTSVFVSIIFFGLLGGAYKYRQNILKRIFPHHESCSICLEYLNQYPIWNLRCTHKFHRNCIQQWYQQQRHCPNCRQPFNLSDVY